MISCERFRSQDGSREDIFLMSPSTKQPPSEATSRAEAEDAQALEGVQVLLVEDHDDTRELFTFVLRRAGAIVRAVPGVPMARAEIVASRPDVIVTDIAMPGENGLNLVEWLRRDPSQPWSNVPAVAVSGVVNLMEGSRELREGFQVCLLKPVRTDMLVQVVARLAGRGGSAQA